MGRTGGFGLPMRNLLLAKKPIRNAPKFSKGSFQRNSILKWSGYIRTSLINAPLAKLMVQSGVGDLEVAVTAGSQKVLNSLHMGFKLEHLYDGCRHLKEAGFKGRVILNYSLNSPDETEETPAAKH